MDVGMGYGVDCQVQRSVRGFRSHWRQILWPCSLPSLLCLSERFSSVSDSARSSFPSFMSVWHWMTESFSSSIVSLPVNIVDWLDLSATVEHNLQLGNHFTPPPHIIMPHKYICLKMYALLFLACCSFAVPRVIVCPEKSIHNWEAGM